MPFLLREGLYRRSLPTSMRMTGTSAVRAARMKAVAPSSSLGSPAFVHPFQGAGLQAGVRIGSARQQVLNRTDTAGDDVTGRVGAAKRARHCVHVDRRVQGCLHRFLDRPNWDRARHPGEA